VFQVTPKSTAALLVAALLSGCGGGSGGGDSTSSAASNSAVKLSWTMPQSRENGQPLDAAEIQGCVVVAVQQQQLEDQQALLLDLIPSQQAFNEQQQQLNRFINGSDLAAVISAGLPEAILIYSSEQTNYRFDDIGPGTYHFAVSCFDWDDLYSSLSNTVTKTL
jgi:hypothetical protein